MYWMGPYNKELFGPKMLTLLSLAKRFKKGFINFRMKIKKMCPRQ